MAEDRRKDPRKNAAQQDGEPSMEREKAPSRGTPDTASRPPAEGSDEIPPPSEGSPSG